MKLPNLFLVGAMKCATTSLQRYLREHPEVFMSRPKEPCFFVEREALRREWPNRYRDCYSGDLERYLALFDAVAGERWAGEGSVWYTLAPEVAGVPERIHRFNPDARIIYIVRDPLQRTVSHYWHRVRLNRERRPIGEAVAQHPAYVDVSHYPLQIEPYLQRFGPEQVRLITLEELRDQPDDVLAELFGWLQVDAGFRRAGEVRQNVTSPDVVWAWRDSGRVHALGRTPTIRRWKRRLPAWVSQFASHLVYQRIKRDRLVQPEELEQLRDQLHPVFQPQVKRLGELFGRSFDWDCA